MFLNVPFDVEYEPLFVALVSALVSLGLTPRCVLEIPDGGQGRLTRILKLLQGSSCSIHDLSRVEQEVRFNMPFELGMAVAIARTGGRHKIPILEAERFRLDKTLSDVKGIDPGIHGGKVAGIISCVLSHFANPLRNPSPTDIRKVQNDLRKVVRTWKSEHSRDTIYSRAIFRNLVVAATELCQKHGLIE